MTYARTNLRPDIKNGCTLTLYNTDIKNDPTWGWETYEVTKDRLAAIIGEHTGRVVYINSLNEEQYQYAIECILKNPIICMLEFRGEFSDYCKTIIESINCEQIKHLTFAGDEFQYDWILSDLQCWKYLRSLTICSLLDPTSIEILVEKIRETNITDLYLTTYSFDEDPTKLTGLFQNNKLRTLELTFVVYNNHDMVVPIDIFQSLGDSTLDHFGLTLDGVMSNEHINAFANAIIANKTITSLSFSDESRSVNSTLLNAINTSKTITSISIYPCSRDDIHSFMKLLNNDRIENIDMDITSDLISQNSDALVKCLANNLRIQCCCLKPQLGTDNIYNYYLRRNKMLVWGNIQKSLINFAMIFIHNTEFDPWVVVQLFDEWYLPEYIYIYSHRKVKTVFDIRKSIIKVKKSKLETKMGKLTYIDE